MKSKTFQAEHADRIARSLESDAMSALRMLLSRPELYADTVIDADLEPGMNRPEFDRRVRAVTTPEEYAFLASLGELTSSTPGEDGIQIRRWARNRIIYVVDPDTAQAVSDTEWGDTAIPGEVLRQLPHTNPLVILPDPVRIPGDDGHIEKYEAFAVLGFRAPRRRADTHDPECTGYVLHFFGRLVDPATDKPIMTEIPQLGTGKLMTVPNVVGMRVLTPLKDMTMQERQDFAAADVKQLGPIAQIGFKDEADALQRTRELTALGLSLLVYLVTDNLDAQKTVIRPSGKKERKQRASKNPPHAPHDTTVIEVGYRIGAALRAAKKAHEHGSRASGKRTVSPHVRRAHVHTFRYGKGRAFRKLKWLPPIAINAGQVPEKTQVHFTR